MIIYVHFLSHTWALSSGENHSLGREESRQALGGTDGEKPAASVSRRNRGFPQWLSGPAVKSSPAGNTGSVSGLAD